MAGCAPIGKITEKIRGKKQFNFIVILTDDQRWDTLWAMPIVQEQLMAKGKTFTNAFITTPVCCPARASILSGGFYAHNTGVLTNRPLNGTMGNFNDTYTLATLLQDAGYKTGFIGKYMHGHYPRYVPPGWTEFIANNEGGMLKDWFNLKDITTGSSTSEMSWVGALIKDHTQYLTYFQRDKALDFIEQYGDGSAPFFLFLSTYAPHVPATPAPGDEGLFKTYYYNGRATGEKDLSDKPAWVQRAALSKKSRYQKEHPQKQLRSLKAVDRTVGAIVDKIAEKGLLDRTVFIFTSDNGVTWGEHRLPNDKGMPYEESIRVPFVVRMPAIEPGTDDHLVAVNLDMGATILELANVPGYTDGLSLFPLLRGFRTDWREEILIESFRYLDWRLDVPGLWAGLRVKSEDGEWKYVEHPTGEKELYDLVNDPFEKESKHNNPNFHHKIIEFSEKLEKMKGLAITVFEAPEGVVGQEYSFRLTAWGGEKPYRWTVHKGQLPAGLSLDDSSGLISGVPLEPGNRRVFIRVTSDSSIARHSGKPQTFIWDFYFNITSISKR